MNLNRNVVPFAAAALAAAFAITSSCGTSTTATVSTPITAAKGGLVEAPSGKGKLNIPADALGTDTTITLALSPATDGSASEVFEFGPSGTKFSKPAMLEIAVDASKVVAGKTMTLALFENGKWNPIAGSTYASGKVTGPVAHFSKFTVIFVDGNAVLTSACESEIAAYSPCGGNIVGTWYFKDYCFKSKILGADPFNGKCPGFIGTIEYTIDGPFTVTSTTTQAGALTSTISYNWTIPVSCFSVDAGIVQKSCADLQASFKKKEDGGVTGTCSEVGANCVCVQSEAKTEPAKNPEPYSVSGNNFVQGDGGISTTTYCVKNDKLYVNATTADGGGTLVVFRK